MQAQRAILIDLAVRRSRAHLHPTIPEGSSDWEAFVHAQSQPSLARLFAQLEQRLLSQKDGPVAWSDQAALAAAKSLRSNNRAEDVEVFGAVCAFHLSRGQPSGGSLFEALSVEAQREWVLAVTGLIEEGATQLSRHHALVALCYLVKSNMPVQRPAPQRAELRGVSSDEVMGAVAGMLHRHPGDAMGCWAFYRLMEVCCIGLGCFCMCLPSPISCRTSLAT